MRRTPPEIRRMIAEFEAVLRRRGVKVTPQRLEIYRRTAERADHPDIEAIHRAVGRSMPHVSLDTVYRALALFERLGLVASVRPHGQPHTRFDANVAPHHHFVCGRCGTTLDFEDRAFDRLRLPPSASALGRVVSRHVELRGLCAACLAGAAPPAGPPRASRPPHRRLTTDRDAVPSSIHQNPQEGSTCPTRKR